MGTRGSKQRNASPVAPLQGGPGRDCISIFSAFSAILTEHSDIKNIMAASVRMLSEAMDADFGWVCQKDADTGEIVLLSCAGCDEDRLGNAKRVAEVMCPEGREEFWRQPVLIEDASKDARLPELISNSVQISSMAIVPVISGGKTWGSICLASKEPSRFTQADVQMLTILAAQLGIAVDKAGLIEELHGSMNQLKLIDELSSTVNSSLSIGTIFRIIVSELRKLVEYDRASILIYEEDKDDLLIYALDTEMKTVMSKGVRAPIAETSAGWVVRQNRPWINRDLAEEVPFALDSKLRDEGIRSTISIPLYQDKMLGVFNLDSTKPRTYAEKEMDILLPAAKHIAIALENALLFEEISKEKKEWEKTFDAITDMVWIEDLNQRVVRVNRALLKRTGLSAVDLTGMGCGELLGHIGLGSRECLCDETIAMKRPTFKELKSESGGLFNFWAYPLIDEGRKLYAIVHYLKDVTSQRRLEQELIRSDKLASLGTLVAGIAHEINNPLGIIAGYSEALLDRARDKRLLEMEGFGDFPEYLEMIHSEIFRCKEILGSLLEFSRPHRGKARELDINELLMEVILLVKHRAKRLHFELELDLNRELPKIQAEPGSLRQLFMNIIINSMYFTPEGGSISIKTEKSRNTVDGGFVAVAISDTGPGIAQDIIDKIFDPFFTTKPIGEGTGLGLSISHRIAQEHGGKIEVRSEPGRGTTFVVKLPAKA